MRPDSSSSRRSKAGSRGEGSYGVGIDVGGWLRGDIRNTPTIAETNGEGAGIQEEMEGGGERKEVRSIVTCKEDQGEPSTFTWNWGEDNPTIVHQYAYLGVEI